LWSATLFAGSAKASAERSQSLATEGWRLFEITTHVHVQNASGLTRAWLPTPLVGTPYQQTLGDTYHAEGGRVVMVESEELDLLYAEWPAGADPILNLTSRVATRDHLVDLANPRVPPPPDLSGFSRDLRPLKAAKVESDAMPLSGTDVERARQLYDRPHDAAGDPNGAEGHLLFVARARAAGIPARPVYGLGLGNPNATSAQRCRAEVYLIGFGWIPVDLGARSFGVWRAPWSAFNTAHDVALPKSAGRALPYFMYPQAETANGRVDSQAAETFRYDIAVRDVT
jgi:hypothetical protein